MENQSLPPRLLAEQLIGTDNLFQLDKAGIGVFSRSGLHAKQVHTLGLEAENKKLCGLLAATLASLPFLQRFRLVHSLLAIPIIIPGRARKNVVRRRRRRVVRAQGLVSHGKRPSPVIVGADAEGAKAGLVQKQHGGLTSYPGAPLGAAETIAEQDATSNFWERIRFIPANTPTNLSDLPADLREFILRCVREFKREHSDTDVQQEHVAVDCATNADDFNGLL